MGIEQLIKARKRVTTERFTFPTSGSSIDLNVEVVDSDDRLLLTINRKGAIRLDRCTYFERTLQHIPLVRLDLDKNKPHSNPDGRVIFGPHIHIYCEGYEDKWAYLIEELDDLPEGIFASFDNLHQTLLDFFTYCNIECNAEFGGELE